MRAEKKLSKMLMKSAADFGKSINSKLYSIKSIEEADAYLPLADPVLGPRLRSATKAILESD